MKLGEIKTIHNDHKVKVPAPPRSHDILWCSLEIFKVLLFHEAMWAIKSKVCHKIYSSQSQGASKSSEAWLAGRENLVTILGRER